MELTYHLRKNEKHLQTYLWRGYVGNPRRGPTSPMEVVIYGTGQPTPPDHVPPPEIKHCFPLVRPAIKPLFLRGGVRYGGVG